MIFSTFSQYLLLLAASAAAGAINAVAGGGTLLTFPALIGVGELQRIANATSTTALLPGQGSSLWGLRREVRETLQGRPTVMAQLLLIGTVGGAAGAFLFLRTPETVFQRVIPFLILLAVGLFAAQESLTGVRKPAGELPAVQPDGDRDTLRLTLPVAAFLLVIAVYGGFFGAGIGILTLVALHIVGMRDIHRRNGIKAIFTLGVNGVAVIGFALSGLVNWKLAALMAMGSVFGGYAGVGIAKRMGQANVRRVVIIAGLIVAGNLFWNTYFR